ncbi:MAG: hypothetical protein K1X83_05685 [Oligoflexia bacterium]|nr:hypothetical protein [Oligoflexia bacterium]
MLQIEARVSRLLSELAGATIYAITRRISGGLGAGERVIGMTISDGSLLVTSGVFTQTPPGIPHFELLVRLLHRCVWLKAAHPDLASLRLTNEEPLLEGSSCLDLYQWKKDRWMRVGRALYQGATEDTKATRDAGYQLQLSRLVRQDYLLRVALISTSTEQILAEELPARLVSVCRGMPIDGYLRFETGGAEFRVTEKKMDTKETQQLQGEVVSPHLLLGNISLSIEEILALRPGEIVQFDLPSPLEVAVALGSAEWAKADLTIEAGQAHLKIRTLSIFEETSET